MREQKAYLVYTPPQDPSIDGALDVSIFGRVTNEFFLYHVSDKDMRLRTSQVPENTQMSFNALRVEIDNARISAKRGR